MHEVVLVSSPYHSLRVERIADDVGLDGHASPVSEEVPADQEEQVAEAAHSCPEQAIVIE